MLPGTGTGTVIILLTVTTCQNYSSVIRFGRVNLVALGRVNPNPASLHSHVITVTIIAELKACV